MKLFHPDRKFERFEDVTPEILKKDRIKLLLTDLDNTLTARLSKEPAAKLGEWLKDCKSAGTKVVIISNNMSKKRVQRLCKPFNLECIWWAKKPLSTKLTAVREKHHIAPENTAMLGDKWSTDVLAARFAGIKAWKVEHRKGVLSSDERSKNAKN